MLGRTLVGASAGPPEFGESLVVGAACGLARYLPSGQSGGDKGWARARSERSPSSPGPGKGRAACRRKGGVSRRAS